MSYNRIIVQGNLGGDAEQRTDNNNNPFWKINVATSQKWKDKNSGEDREETIWHSVILRGNYQNLVPYLRKGQAVLVEGVQKNISYDLKDQSGNIIMNGDRAVKGMYSFIKCDRVNLVGSAQQQAQPAVQTQQTQPTPQQPNNQFQPQADDLPF